MSRRFDKKVIEDIQASNVSDVEQTWLVEIFRITMGTMAPTLIREAHFELADFAMARGSGLEPYSLTLKRTRMAGRELWIGVFEYGNKRLQVMGSLEK
jgi:hypothetical protein